MTEALPFTRLAHTRLCSGRGGHSGPVSFTFLGSVRNRLSTTCWGVRTQGARVNTAATVAIFLRLTFCPLVSRTERCGLPGLTMGMPLQSTAVTKMEAVCCQGWGALDVESVEVLGRIL